MKLFKQDEEPSSRRIKLKTLPNTRDLSDVPNQMGLRIKPHRLIRSGTLGGAGRRDIKTLTKTTMIFRARSAALSSLTAPVSKSAPAAASKLLAPELPLCANMELGHLVFSVCNENLCPESV